MVGWFRRAYTSPVAKSPDAFFRYFFQQLSFIIFLCIKHYTFLVPRIVRGILDFLNPPIRYEK